MKLMVMGLITLVVAQVFSLECGVAQAADTKSSLIPAPAAQYLMADRNEEIALARSAAPGAISGDADVLVLGAHGYETAVKGHNGFSCFVGRSWMLLYDDPEFLNPKVRLPACLNPSGARWQLPLLFKATELAVKRVPKSEMFDALASAYRDKELPLPEPGAMCYMMSKQQYFGPKYKNADPHLMFWFAQTGKIDWGANKPHVSVYMTQDAPDPVSTFVIPALTWSDGSPNLVDGH
ncbi:MAG TPA: hypothetical protein VKB67_06705 [Rhizomicrobium sp.]|nr:hypothetical protein [Rhizomicrobium sp.]